MRRLIAWVLAALALILIAHHVRLPNAAPTYRLTEAQTRGNARMAQTEPAGDINVNTASADVLETLPHVGPAIAQRIVEEREQNGPFHYSQDLLSVRGIGEKTLQKLLEWIRLH